MQPRERRLSRKGKNFWDSCHSVGRSSSLILILFSTVCLSAEIKPTYTLGPEDKLLLKVWDVRNGDPYQWVALNGEFSVGPDGLISLPLVGEIKAAGESLSSLTTKVGSALQIKVGLSTRPDASIQIIKYRPFYVTGSVEKPGRYEYQPNLTVIQAISTASGIVRVSGTQLYGVIRESTNARGDIRVLSIERLSLLARQARLAAEITSALEVNYPPELKDPKYEKLVKEETMLFRGKKESLEAKLAAINQSKSVISSQLESLSAKNNSLNRQLDLTRKDLNQVSELLNKGMAIAPRKLSAEQNVASYESSQLDVQIATLKAQQDLSQATRDLVDLRSKYKTDALQEATEIRAKIDSIEQKIVTAKALINQADTLAPELSQNDDELSPRYFISRQSDPSPIIASETDFLQPGDVLRVELPKQRGSSMSVGVSEAQSNLRNRGQ